MNHRIPVLEVDLPAAVTQAAGITLRPWIKTGLELKVMKIRVERAFLVVIVDLALPDHHMTYFQVEDTRLALPAALCLREIRFAAFVDEYVSDPAHPVPFVDYISSSVPQRYMVDDQRFAARRPDVLVYETEPLEEDVTFAGPVSPKLKVASTGTDSDFVVKLIDVYPDDYPDSEGTNTSKRVLGPPSVRMGGYQQLLRGEPMRAKFRNSWEKPEPLTPGKLTEVDFAMPDVFHTFRKGHRIMVQVQSSWFPLMDRNPQTFTEIPYAKPADFKKATEEIFHSKDQASAIEVLVLAP